MIESVSVVHRGKVVNAVPTRYVEGRFDVPKDLEPFDATSVPRGEEREPFVMVDVVGYNSRRIADKVLSKVPMKGFDVWYLTGVRDIEDVFDSFMMDIDRLLVPCHLLSGQDSLEEIFDVSEDCIPTIFAVKGMTGFSNSIMDIRKVMDVLSRVGFPEAIVFDTDSKVGNWDRFKGTGIETIPMVSKDSVPLGFDRAITY